MIALILGSVAVSPWWAPALAPLLPWSRSAPAPAPQAAGASDEANRRLGTLEQRLAAAEQQLNQLAQRPAPDAASSNPDEAAAGRIEALEKRLAAAEQSLSQLGSQPGQPAAPDAALAPLREAVERQKDELATLAGRVAALEQRPGADPAALADLQGATAKLGAALATLDQRVATLASTVANVANANASEAAASIDPALLLALGQLRQALQGSGPFVAELTAVTTLATDRADVKAALAPLAEAAPKGVPSLALLRQRFDGLAGAIAGAGAAPAAADDWGSQVLGKLRGLVSVRRVGSAAGGDGPDAAVAQAESALSGDDLAGAVTALETLHGPPMVAARDWLEAARRRLAAEAALGKTTALVTARLANDRKPATPAAAGAKP